MPLDVPADLPPDLRQARALHQAGDFAAAQQIYNRILRDTPDDVAALHLAARLALQTDRPARCVELVSRALHFGLRNAAAYCTLAAALRALQHPDEGLASCEAAITINPSHCDAYFQRGLMLQDLQRPAEALAAYDHVIALQPNLAEAHCNRGVVLAGLNRVDAALCSYDTAIGLQPDYAGAHSNRGALLADLQRHDLALAAYDAALAINDAFPEAWCNRGVTLAELGRLEDAVASHDRAIALRPDYADAHYNCGLVLVQLNQPHAALARFDRAIALRPDYAQAWSDRGLALAALDCHAEAEASHARAIALQPAFAGAYSNRGLVLADMHRHDEARSEYDKAIALQPDLPDAHWNKSLSLLATGDFEQGWPLYEWRKLLKQPMGHTALPGPQWRGDVSLEGKTLFIHWEQGFGDTIQFCRYGALAASRGARVVMSVQDALRPLLRQLAPTIEIVGAADATVAFHYQCALLSLPLAFGTTIETIPARRAYLSADPATTRRWQERLPRRHRLRIGIAWRGNPLFRKDYARSTDFATIAPLLDILADWICLVKQPTPKDTAFIQQHDDVTFLGDELVDFADTASVIELMDLIITTDTSIAHLAGAMGKPVWIMLSAAPDWRWMLNGNDSPWYPTARLFRQHVPGQWQGMITTIKEALISDAGPVK